MVLPARLAPESAVNRSLDDLAALQGWIRAGANGTFVADCRITSTVRAPWLSEWMKASQAAKAAVAGQLAGRKMRSAVTLFRLHIEPAKVKQTCPHVELFCAGPFGVRLWCWAHSVDRVLYRALPTKGEGAL